MIQERTLEALERGCEGDQNGLASATRNHDDNGMDNPRDFAQGELKFPLGEQPFNL